MKQLYSEQNALVNLGVFKDITNQIVCPGLFLAYRSIRKINNTDCKLQFSAGKAYWSIEENGWSSDTDQAVNPEQDKVDTDDDRFVGVDDCSSDWVVVAE